MLARVSTSGPGTFYCFMFENDSLKNKNLSFKTVNLRSPAVEDATSSESPFSNRYMGFGTTIRGDVHTDFGEICSHVLVSGSKIMGAGEPKDPGNERIGIVAFKCWSEL